MAGFFDSISSGVSKINIKTNNAMESAKIKTIISSVTRERDELAKQVGYQVYDMEKAGNVDNAALKPLLAQMEQKNAQIAEQEQELKKIETLDEQVFGKHEQRADDPTKIQPGEPTVYCQNCGALNAARFKFCVKCGQPLN